MTRETLVGYGSDMAFEPLRYFGNTELRPRILGSLLIATVLLAACSKPGLTPVASADSETRPAAPVLSTGVRHQTSVTVTWTAPATDEAITGYELQWRSTSDPDWTMVTGIAGTATSYTITGLQPQTSYEIRVRPVFATTESAWSESLTVSTKAPATAPNSNPPTLTRSAPSANSITVTWTAPATDEAITGYELQWRNTSDPDWTVATGIAGTATSYTITGLQPQTSYEIRVRPVFATTDGAWSESIRVSTTAPATSPVSNRPVLSQSTLSKNSITVTWTAPATAQAITGYELHWKAYFLKKWNTVPGIAGTANRYTITGLQPGVLYDVRVRALHGSSVGRWSAVLRGQTEIDDTGPPFVTFYPSGEIRVSESAAGFGIELFVFHPAPEYFPMTVKYRLSESGDVLHAAGEHNVTIPATFPYVGLDTVRVVDDDVDEPDSTVTVTILPGTGYRVGLVSSETATVIDDD